VSFAQGSMTVSIPTATRVAKPSPHEVAKRTGAAAPAPERSDLPSSSLGPTIKAATETLNVDNLLVYKVESFLIPK
jgi:hypothetical protein